MTRFANIMFKIGYKQTKEHREKIGDANRGKKKPAMTEETKRKIGESNRISRKGMKFTKEHRINLSESHKNPSKEIRKRMSEARKGTHPSEETKRKMRLAKEGEKSHFWKGGISFEPYSVNWTMTLKRSIRERDNYTCMICGKEQCDKTFCIHHIDYDKKNCDPKNLITLCNSCHTKTNSNREKWIKFFININDKIK